MSCQKGSNNQPAIEPTKSQQQAVDENAIPEKVCSDDLKKLLTQFSDNQKQIANIFEQIKEKKGVSSLNNEYKERGEKQVENCRKIDDRFTQEKITGCLRSENSKTKENSIFKSTYLNNCKSIALWAKNFTQKEASGSELKFDSSAIELIRTAGQSNFSFISEGSIKSGADEFEKIVRAGKQACMITSQNQPLPESSVFEYVTDSSDSNTEIGFEFNGTRTVIVFKDSSHTLHSLLCLNTKLSTEKDKKAALQKIFGSKIQIQEKEPAKKVVTEIVASEATDLLNKDVAATPGPSDVGAAATKDNSSSSAAAAAVTAGAKAAGSLLEKVNVNESVEKIGNKVKEVTDHGVEKVKEVADHGVEKVEQATTKVIKEAKDAGVAIITQAQESASIVAKKAIKDAQDAIIETATKPFVVVKDAILYFPKKIYNFFSSLFTSDKDKEKEKKEAEAAKAAST